MVMTGCRDMNKIHQKCPKYVIFFTNLAFSPLYPYGALTSCKKLEKTNVQSLGYLKTDRPMDQRTNGHTNKQG